MIQMHRRSFLKGTLLTTLAAQTRHLAAAPTGNGAAAIVETGVVCTPPTLQIPAPTSMGVAWGVTSRATGFVDFGKQADLSDARRVFAGSGGLKALDDTALGVRLTGLEPNTRYHYRTGTLPIDFRGAYKILPGEPVLSERYTFRTPGVQAPASFAVINDTHENRVTFPLLHAKLEQIDPAVTIWNGDLCNAFNTLPQMRTVLLNPCDAPFAAQRPVLFVPGNHDYRGLVARELPRMMLTREPTERARAFWTLGRNFAYRQGEIALIGLDTGEDKPDWHKAWGGLAQFKPYRELQARWLADALARPEIREAPYVVAFCHIPLFDDSPNANPGEIEQGYASWQRSCHDLWSPLLEQHKVQVVITAHKHRFRCDAPAGRRTWMHLVGGAGCDVPPKGQLTVLAGHVDEGRLRLTAHNLTDNSVLGTYAFTPRA